MTSTLFSSLSQFRICFFQIQLQLNDNVLSWTLGSDGEYTEVIPTDERAINNHTVLEDYMNKIYKAQKKDTSSHKAEKLARRLFKES
jgi:polyphosphate kinase